MKKSSSIEINWTSGARAEYLSEKRSGNDKTLRIDTIVESILRNPKEGIGSPVPLKGILSNCYSRRIDSSNRLVYLLTEEKIFVLTCKNKQ